MTWYEALLLGCVQGATEFLPVSSSAHLILTQTYLGFQIDGAQILFDLLLHVATLLSIVVFFWSDLCEIWRKRQSYALFLALSLIPTIVLGYTLSQWESLFLSVSSVAYILGINGAMLLLAHVMSLKTNEKELSRGKALLVGAAQGLAVLPGLSRSGATISAALVLGVSRREALRYSFILAIPTILMAFGFRLLTDLDKVSSLGIMPMIVGFLAAFSVGCVCLWFLKRLVLGRYLYVFTIYCLGISLWLLRG